MLINQKTMEQRELKFNAGVIICGKKIYLKNIEISSDGSIYIHLDDFREQTKELLTAEEFDLINEDYGRSSDREYFLHFTETDCDLKKFQLTPLIDKNKKNIYEGDIVKPFPEDNYAQIIFMKDGAFKIATKRKNGNYLIWNYMQLEIEIKGNIYENSDLLS